MSHQKLSLSTKGILLATTLFFGMTALASTEYPAVPGEYVVKMKSDVTAHMPMGHLSQIMGGKVVRYISKSSNTILLKRNTPETAAFVMNSVSDNPLVEYIEPNYIYTIDAIPNDPYLKRLWGMINNGGSRIDIDADKAWDLQTGSKEIVVAVICTFGNFKNRD